MNLLAHLWLADRSATSPAGQILGDIVKGRLAENETRFSAAIDQGIRLHRRIDSHCDDHWIHRDLRRRFEPPLRRYAGIIVDIGLDHALARRWADFSEEPLSAFARRAGNLIEAEWPENAPDSAPDAVGLSRLITGYAEPVGIERALRSVGHRLRRRNPLADSLPALLREYHAFERGLPTLLAALEQTVGVRS
ncbi:ACP phosphodiesterase [Salinisphaera sp. SPP-AMP-43]|uniref:acyl carrier protein phosphodiesterase n=1 Tax=Salinisphaera sp. SPP-AMP-43 TaxID=3121288 RepID=UPI003C6E02E7